ncbi:MAG TPA: phosphate-starvation-inducible PsiE family protein [Candidatus Hydrogenedens sp.]|nr:phosphate-starvation-inducible PsiE family protein [Candidatus Hydrogenedens sp.]
MSIKEKDIDTHLLNFSHGCIRWIVRFLTLMMILVIAYSALDIVSIVVLKIINIPKFFITIDDLLDIFGAFLSVLIAIEIYENIVLYLRRDVIHVQVVVATALIAISRKVIVMDFNKVEALNILALGVLVIAVATAYWLVSSRKMILSNENEKNMK